LLTGSCSCRTYVKSGVLKVSRGGSSKSQQKTRLKDREKDVYEQSVCKGKETGRGWGSASLLLRKKLFTLESGGEGGRSPALVDDRYTGKKTGNRNLGEKNEQKFAVTLPLTGNHTF